MCGVPADVRARMAGHPTATHPTRAAAGHSRHVARRRRMSESRTDSTRLDATGSRMVNAAKAALVDESALEQRRVTGVVAAARLEPIVVARRHRPACGKHRAAQDESDR